jgi:hypothetical protein
MVTLVKHEWHQVDSQFAFELTLELLAEIYPDLSDEELADKLAQIESGDIDVDEVISDAEDADVYFDWERQYDDWWTDRKGGYDVTYELGDEDSWHEADTPPEPTHKCTKCRWKGQSYETGTLYLNEDGSICESDDLDHHSTKDACPMCDSDVELTEAGQLQEQERQRRQAEWDRMDAEDEEN